MTDDRRPPVGFAQTVRRWAQVADRVEVDHAWDGGAELKLIADGWVLRIGPAEHATYLAAGPPTGPRPDDPA
jgi:hypothetical protein